MGSNRGLLGVSQGVCSLEKHWENPWETSMGNFQCFFSGPDNRQQGLEPRITTLGGPMGTQETGYEHRKCFWENRFLTSQTLPPSHVCTRVPHDTLSTRSTFLALTPDPDRVDSPYFKSILL